MKWAFFIYAISIIIHPYTGLSIAASQGSISHPKAYKIICFGDSLTAGYGAKKKFSYPAQLSRMIGRPIINMGRMGDTTASALKRLKRDVLSRSPRLVLITIGGNDLKNGVPVKIAMRNLKSIVRSIQKRKALIIIGGISFPGLDRGLGGAYRILASETGAILIPNILAGITTNKKLMFDPIHPNKYGYRIIAKRFYTVIRPYL